MTTAVDEIYVPLMESLGHSFANPGLLVLALTHRSQVNEMNSGAEEHNERLEFLGDAVVNLSVGVELMARFPLAREGELSRRRAMAVNEASLALAADGLDLGRHLRLGRGEENTGGRRKASILSDAFEAVMGAIFLDGGFEVAHGVIRILLGPYLAAREGGDRTRDHKTQLQELAQGRWREMPRYEVVDERGPDHAKVFTVAVLLGDRILAEAEGHSKKTAEQRAACRALAKLEELEDEGGGGSG
jgi:ribonuclease-3